MAAMQGKLNNFELEWDQRAALGVVMAASGYPEQVRKNDRINGLENIHDDNCKVFHAGTSLKNDKTVTAGGRVLCVTALGDTVSEAQERAYQTVAKIHYDGMFFRKDIGYRALNRGKIAKN